MNGKLRNMAAIYLTRGDEMLLLYRIGSKVVDPSWCGIGGHFEEGELNNAKAAALRELYEEVGLTEADLIGLTMRYVTLRHKNGEIRQNYYFFAGLKAGVQIPDCCNEGELRWMTIDELPSLPMPLTAKDMLLHYLREGRYNETLYGGITTKDGTVFIPMEDF